MIYRSIVTCKLNAQILRKESSSSIFDVLFISSKLLSFVPFCMRNGWSRNRISQIPRWLCWESKTNRNYSRNELLCVCLSLSFSLIFVLFCFVHLFALIALIPCIRALLTWIFFCVLTSILISIPPFVKEQETNASFQFFIACCQPFCRLHIDI